MRPSVPASLALVEHVELGELCRRHMLDYMTGSKQVKALEV